MNETTLARPYPVRLQSRLDEPLSRWLWLVKWLLAVPHYVVLAFLWLAFVVLTVVAFFAILFTGRYPRSLFDFNVGVMRWSWRVHFYAYGALGTDRYPPFTLADVPEYPARLEIDYPERLSRGLVLVKWLLGLPHYLIVAILAGGGLWFTLGEDGRFEWAAGGLIGLLVLVSAIALAFTGSYPRPLFDFVLGLDRWVVRAGAYAALMTDEYPPFRLDQGGHEPGGAVPPPEDHRAEAATSGWSGGRITSVVAGAVLGLAAMGVITGGAALLWVDQVQRDDDGFLTASRTFNTEGYAVTGEDIALGGTATSELPALRAVVGEMRVRATPGAAGGDVFVGIAPAGAAARYLADVPHTVVGDLAGDGVVRGGTAAIRPPGDETFWVATASGSGPQAVRWSVEPGDWTIVVANADGSRGVNASVQAGAEVPALGLIAFVILLAGVGVLVVATLLIVLAVQRSTREAANTA